MTEQDRIDRARAALSWDPSRRAEPYWRHQYAGDLASAELRALELERHLIRTRSDLARLRSRRWWKLGAALGGMRRPGKDLLATPGRALRAAFGANQLPAAADTSILEDRIAALRSTAQAGHRADVEIANRRYDNAEQITAAALDADPLDYGALAARARLLIATGELTDAHAYLRLLADIHPTAEVEQRIADVRGRIIATDPAWLPAVPGKPEPLGNPVPGRILHLVKESLPYHERGYTMRTMANLAAARAAGFDPVVVTALGFPRADGHGDFPAVSDVEGIRHHHLDLGPDYDPAAVPQDQYLLDWAWRAAEVVREERPAALHAGSGHHGFDTALVGLALSRHFGIPLAYEVRSSLEQTWTGDPAIAEQGEYFARRLAQEDRCVDEAPLVFAINGALRDDLVERGADPARVFELPNGVDPSAFTPRPKRPDLITRLGLGQGPVVGYVSNLGTREGIDTLIDAIGLLRDRGIEVHGLIVGDGPRREALAAQIERLDLTGRVVLTGHVAREEVVDHYALIDVFVVPRTEDRAARLITPLKPFEAMAMGIPVVVADLPALREIVGDERGARFRSGSAEDLAGRLEALLADPESLRRMGEAGRAWVTQERTWDSNGPRLAAAYATLGVTPS